MATNFFANSTFNCKLYNYNKNDFLFLFYFVVTTNRSVFLLDQRKYSKRFISIRPRAGLLNVVTADQQ